MPATALTASSLGANAAFDLSAGVVVDATSGGVFANNGRTMLVITTSATPGTVTLSVIAKDPVGRAVTDVSILDSAGAALAANKTYLVGIGSAAVYGDTATVKTSNAATKVQVLQQAS